MTRILAIEGTDIRKEIDDCDRCPFMAVDSMVVSFAGCNLLGRNLDIPLLAEIGPDGEEIDGNYIAPDCPLPEKVK